MADSPKGTPVQFESPWKDDPLIQIFSRFNNADPDPRVRLIIIHGFVEMLINHLVSAKCKNAKYILNDGRGFPHSTKLLLLHETSIISDRIFQNLSWLRKIRNKVTHDPIFNLTQADFNSCPYVADESVDPRVFNSIKNYSLEKKFNWLFTTVWGLLWNEHAVIFGPEFLPSSHQ